MNLLRLKSKFLNIKKETYFHGQLHELEKMTKINHKIEGRGETSLGHRLWNSDGHLLQKPDTKAIPSLKP